MTNTKFKKNQGFNVRIALPFLTILVAGFLLVTSKGYNPSWSFDWSGIWPEIKDSVFLVQEYGSISSGAVGIAGRTPKEFPTRRWLLKNLSDVELKKLKTYPDGVIRATIFEALLKRQPTQAYELLSEAFSDTLTQVEYHSGCLGYPLLLGEYLEENVTRISNSTPQLFSPKSIEKYQLTKKELVSLREQYKILKKRSFFPTPPE